MLRYFRGKNRDAGTPRNAENTMTHTDGRDHVDGILAQWAEQRPSLNASSMAIFGRLARLSKHCEKARAEALAPFGFKEGEFDVLATLRRAGPPYTLSPTQLYRSLMVTSGAMTNRLNRLETMGWVNRLPNLDDRRGMVVQLTPQGVKIVDEAALVHVETQELILGGLSGPEREQLASLLKKSLLALPGEEIAEESLGETE